MNPSVEVVGVYPVSADEPVFLVEMVVRGAQAFDVGAITQMDVDRPKDDWQAPYNEKILDSSGTSILLNPLLSGLDERLSNGCVRMAFFFHYLDFQMPLLTPFGPVPLPPPTPLPSRLSFIGYEPP